ncbi:MAG: phage tail protein [Sphingobium sp.]
MRKPDSLKKLLLATVPGLATNPESLALFIDNGGIVGGNGRSLSFEYRYQLNAVIEAYAGDDDAVMVPILAWIAEHQPELLNKPGAEPFTFEAEILTGFPRYLDQDQPDRGRHRRPPRRGWLCRKPPGHAPAALSGTVRRRAMGRETLAAIPP